MTQYFIPPFYLCDESYNIAYNTATGRMDSMCNFNSKPFRLLNDGEVSKLNNKLLQWKYGTINTT